MNDCIFPRRQMNAVLFESEWETLKCNDCGTKILLIKKLREEKE